MDNSYKKHIGKVCDIDEKVISRSVIAFNTYILPSIEALKEAYNVLNLENFNQEVFNDLLKQDGIKAKQQDYEKSLNVGDISKMDLKTLNSKNQKLSALPDMIADLRDKRDRVLESYNQALKYGNGEPVYLTWQSFKIINGKVILDETEIVEKATKRITIELQAQWYQILINIQQSQDAAIAFLKSHKLNFPAHAWEQVFTKEPDGSFTILPLAPFVLDSIFAYKKLQDENDRRHQETVKKQRQEREKLWDSITHDLKGRPYEKGTEDHLYKQKLFSEQDDAA